MSNALRDRTVENSRARREQRPASVKLMGVKCTPAQHRRFKHASIRLGLPYADMFDMLLDVYESRERRRAEAAARNANGDKNIPTSPFHDYVQRANPAVRARL